VVNGDLQAGHKRFAVIVPAYNASKTLPDCLAAILASTRKPDEIILYNDGSTDNTEQIARSLDIRVIANPGAPLGPAKGRNIAARASAADIYVFIDADIVIEKDALGALLKTLEDDPALSAVFGSYDRNPRVERHAAAYANLRHHWIHQNSERDAVTFWSGIGAVRKDAFWSVGGFNEASKIEDIDFGARLRAAGGRIELNPVAQGSHCKNWSLLELWRTDIFRRAIPWATLLATGGCEEGHLNGAAKERLSAATAHLCWILLLGALVSKWLAIGALAAACLYIYLNRGLLLLLFRSGGPRLAVSGAALHWLYHLYASITYFIVVMLVRTESWFARAAGAPSDRFKNLKT